MCDIAVISLNVLITSLIQFYYPDNLIIDKSPFKRFHLMKFYQNKNEMQDITLIEFAFYIVRLSIEVPNYN